jgi:hypothetical protein
MSTRFLRLLAALGLVGSSFVVACGDASIELPAAPDEQTPAVPEDAATTPSTEDAGTRPQPATKDAATPIADDGATQATKDATPDALGPRCTTTFGKAVWPEHGRLDGTVRAVIVPGDPICPSDNDHVIVQIDSAGATYPVWINVESNLPTTIDKRVRVATPSMALPAPAWSDGWHGNLALDYTSLGLHAETSFTPTVKTALGTLIVAKVPVGARVSAYAYGFNTMDGAHKVHRNLGGDDGAIVVGGAGSPTWLAFHFAGQTF